MPSQRRMTTASDSKYSQEYCSLLLELCFLCSFIFNINLFLSAIINYRGSLLSEDLLWADFVPAPGAAQGEESSRRSAWGLGLGWLRPRRPHHGAPCPHDPHCQTNTDISLSFLNKAQHLSLGPALVLCRIVALHLKWFLRKGNRTHGFTFASSLVSSAWSC